MELNINDFEFNQTGKLIKIIPMLFKDDVEKILEWKEIAFKLKVEYNIENINDLERWILSLYTPLGGFRALKERIAELEDYLKKNENVGDGGLEVEFSVLEELKKIRDWKN